MSEISIETGFSDGCIYVGLQVDGATPLSLDDARVLGIDEDHYPSTVREPYSGRPYTELTIGSAGIVGFELRQVELAKEAAKIAKLLGNAGHEVHLGKQPQALGYGRHLFGGSDEFVMVGVG